jgi:hypothetical protein
MATLLLRERTGVCSKIFDVHYDAHCYDESSSYEELSFIFEGGAVGDRPDYAFC